MANEVKKVNTIAIADIKNINAITDADLKKLNTLEFTGTVLNAWQGSRGVFAGGRASFTRLVTNEYINIASTSGTSDASGELGYARSGLVGFSNKTRIVWGPAYTDGTTVTQMDNHNPANTTATADFGDWSAAVQDSGGGATNATSGNWNGGRFAGGDSWSNNIEAITIASTSNATDIGSAHETSSGGTGLSNATYGIRAAGYIGGGTVRQNFDKWTIAGPSGSATGVDTGDLNATTYWLCGSEDDSRGVLAGGNDNS